MRVLVVGGGGHAKVCIESLRDCGHEVVGALTRDGAPADVLGVPVIGTDDDLGAHMSSCGAEAVFVAVGDNESRRELIGRVASGGWALVSAVSRHAMVSPSVQLGEGVAVMAGAVVNADTVLARGVIVNSRASVDHDCAVGDCAHVAPGAVVCGGVVIGDSALVGVGAKVLPNRRIGAGAVVGGGALVADDVAASATVVGVPARDIEKGAR
ncbi:MAG: NeuD/PglB/VioB family sugar acetyltransferase [Ilumatobacteraceae bacterium]